MTSLDRVRVLVVAPAPVGDDRIGGIANFIRGFVRYAPDDFEIEIIGTAVGDAARDKGWQRISLAGREVSFLPVARMATARRSGRIPLKAGIVLGMLHHRGRIATGGSVAQVHAPAMELGLLGRNVPTIRVVHNSPGDLAGAKGESAWSRFGGLLQRIENVTFRRAAELYFVNCRTYDEYAKNPRLTGHSHFLPNFYDDALFVPLPPAERAAMRQSLGVEYAIPAEAAWVLFAGRLDQQKDPLLALEAFTAVRPAETTLAPVLLVAGEGRLREAARERAVALGVMDRVRFIGNLPQAQLARLMPATDVFLLTSTFEAGPTVAYEALGAGIPLVSTPVGETHRLVDQGRNGWIAPSATAAELALGLEWALRQDHAGLAELCSVAVAEYTTRNVLKPFFAAHRRLARGSDGG